MWRIHLWAIRHGWHRLASLTAEPENADALTWMTFLMAAFSMAYAISLAIWGPST